MNKLPAERRARVISALVEGNSIRATCRMTGTAKGTVTRLLADLGKACYTYQYRVLRSLRCDLIRCDEVWSLRYAKEQNLQGEHSYGDLWTWTAICADTKLVPCWWVGHRDGLNAMQFMADLQSRLSHPVQLTTDGHSTYLHAVEATFGADIDYTQLIKIYDRPEDSRGPAPRSSLPAGTAIEVQGVAGPEHISISHVERQHLTRPISMRRMSRLTNAFARKVENLSAAVALHFMCYNFGRVHKTLGNRTPAIAAGIADHRWNPVEFARLLD